ncbi:juvenile hormone esterase-like [Phymastichus coffea]|uniref:juvenile hormone esterase-like n=1 Tax=Phymastichus coffea TaxID=108790 RepID=UPI00273B4B77|nr:juvenile hormone esterase-like [Phymastichus coffea]XP_058792793.1 juvenile hormone esterase-like [Phymastichus coffea]
MNKKYCFIMRTLNLRFYLLHILIIGIEAKDTQVVQTSKGLVQGEVLKTVIDSVEYSSFKGIPYAEPPLGYLRFKPPVPKNPWQDILSTRIEGPNCVQKDFIYQTNYTGSEDCLYLNVYTPKLDLQNDNSNLLPVMVWIYGGSFKGGYGNSSLYGPDFMIEDDVVVVTFNYRVGPLGFLNLNHENATGNAGLKDQNLVLRWVKENIHHFGGNPDNVTIFGQSAGAVSVDLHGLSEMSQGLFHRSISMSASPLCPWAFHTPEVAVKQAFKLVKKLGKTTLSATTALQSLYQASAVEIMINAEDMGMVDPPFKPTIESTSIAKNEEKFLTKCSFYKYVVGDFNKVPHITGFTAYETLLFAGSVESILDFVTFASSVLKTLPENSPISLPITQKVFSMTANEIVDLTNMAIMELIDETSDILFKAGINLKKTLLNQQSEHPVYFYRFSYNTSNPLHKQIYNINLNGTAHGDDLAYLFHLTVANISLSSNDPTYITRRRMVRFWTNFAKYGNPTPNGHKDTLLQGITWPDSRKSDEYLEFNQDLAIKENPVDTRVELIETANLAILPIQTGCVGDLINKIKALNPLKSSGKIIKQKIKDIIPSSLPKFT